MPGWLLRIVVAFLKERRIVVNFKGELSSEMAVPVGGPQGTIIALLLFLVLINDFSFVCNEFRCLNVSILVIVTKDVVKNFDVVIAAIAALEVRMLVLCMSATISTLWQ